MSFRDSLIAMVVVLLWGGQVTAVKISGVELPPILMVAIRFVIIGIIFLPFAGWPDKRKLKELFSIATLTGTIHFGLLYWSIMQMTASSSAIAYQLTTPFTVILAILLLGERVTLQTIGGILLAFAGVVTAMGGMGDGDHAIGFLWVTLAALAFAASTVLIKKWGPFPPLQLSSWVALIAAPELLVLSYGLEHDAWGSVLQASVKSWTVLVYIALSGGAVGFVLWYWLIGRYAVSKLVPYTLLIPVVAVTISHIVLEESITSNLVIGGTMALTGVALCQRSSAPSAIIKEEKKYHEI